MSNTNTQIKNNNLIRLYAEFGIIDTIDKSKNYKEYEPLKYNCINFEDDAIDDWFPHINNLKVYFHSISNPKTGLARWGITLIPPESLREFYEIVSKHTKNIYKSKKQLLKIILDAIKQDKFMIHFGV